MALVVIPRTRSDVAITKRVAPGTESGDDASAAPVAASAGELGPDARYLVVGILLLAVGAGAGWVLHQQALYSFTPAPGISAFALFYVFAQGLERVTELLSLMFPGIGRTNGKIAGVAASMTKRMAIDKRDESLARAINGAESAETPAKAAAEAQSALDRIRQNRALLAWTFTSAVAMAGAGLLGLRLIAAISAAPTAGSRASAPLWLDLILTGLVIGGGTKPLHDLIAGLQENRKAKQDPPAAGGK